MTANHSTAPASAQPVLSEEDIRNLPSLRDIFAGELWTQETRDELACMHVPRLIDHIDTLAAQLLEREQQCERLQELVREMLPSVEWELEQWGEGNNFDEFADDAGEVWHEQEALISRARAALKSASGCEK